MDINLMSYIDTLLSLAVSDLVQEKIPKVFAHLEMLGMPLEPLTINWY